MYRFSREVDLLTIGLKGSKYFAFTLSFKTDDCLFYCNFRSGKFFTMAVTVQVFDSIRDSLEHLMFGFIQPTSARL